MAEQKSGVALDPDSDSNQEIFVADHEESEEQQPKCSDSYDPFFGPFMSHIFNPKYALYTGDPFQDSDDDERSKCERTQSECSQSSSGESDQFRIVVGEN